MFKKIFILISLLLLQSCQSTNPHTGKRNFNTVSESQEKSLGQRVYKQSVQQYGIFKDPLLNDYVESIGQKMVKNIKDARFEYQFTLTPQSMINAFAAPGGYIFLTRGILAAFNTEDELASVIGHEITHVTAKHTAQKISQQNVSNLFTMGVLLATRQENLAKASNLVGSAYMSGYGRDNELESDHYGLKLANESGYDPAGALSFMKTLQRFSGSPPSGFSQLFASHPKPSDRISKIKNTLITLENRHNNPDSLNKQRKKYFDKIEGIFVGDWPLYGGILERAYQRTYINPYYHIKIPENSWKFKINKQQPYLEMKHAFRYTQAQVYMLSNREKKQHKILETLQHNNFKTLIFPGLSAKVYENSLGNKTELYITFSRNNREYIFIFSGPKSHLLKDAKQLLRSISLKNPQESLALGAATLKIIPTKPADSYRSLSLQLYQNADYAKDLAYFNGQEPSEKPYAYIKRWVPSAQEKAILNY